MQRREVHAKKLVIVRQVILDNIVCPLLANVVGGSALLTARCEAALDHFHESIMQGLDDTYSDMMSDLLAWRNHHF